MTQDAERQPLLQDDGQHSASFSSRDSQPPAVPKSPAGASILVVIGLMSPVFLGALDTTIVATLITPIGSHFRQSHRASYLGSSYLLSVCCFTPLYGRLSDIFGRRGAMILGLTLFTTGTLFCGLARSMNMLIISRAVAGMGGGGIMTVSSIAMTDIIPLKQRGLFQGLSNIFFGLGSGLGGPLGGWISDIFGWRWAFLVQIPLLLLSMALVALKVKIELPEETQDLSIYAKLRRVDWLGSLTLVFAVGCLLLGVTLKTAEDIPWSSPLIWGTLTGSAVAAILFVAVETLWSSSPIMPLRILAKRTPMLVAWAGFLLSITGFTMLYNIPLYFSAVRLMTASQAGFHLLPITISLPIGGIFAGWLIHRTGKYYYLAMVSALLAAVSGVLVALWDKKTTAFALWFDIAPNGLGGSSLTTALLIALIASVSKEDIAVSTGVFYLFRTTGQVLGVTLSAAVVQAVLIRQLRSKITGPGSQELIELIRHKTEVIPSLDPSLQKAAVDSYAMALRVVFIWQACLAVVTVLMCLRIEEKPLPDVTEETAERVP